MKFRLSILALLAGLAGQAGLAQTNEPADDWQPSPLNQPGQEYPQVKALFASCGSKENPGNINANHDALNSIGLKNTAYVSPDTAHEFLTWRRSLREFAPLLFRY